MSRKILSLGLAFSMLGGLALAQSTTTGTPSGSYGANTTPATEGTLNGNHGSSSVSKTGNTSSTADGSSSGTDDSMHGGNAMGSGPSHVTGNGSTEGTIAGGGHASASQPASN
jgi:hypothetical protein